MYRNVPSNAPVVVWSPSAAILASPKSATQSRPESSTKRLEGLTSLKNSLFVRVMEGLGGLSGQ
jgi:hypothetical protein